MVKLENHCFAQPRLQLVKDLFIFCCYTGLAYHEMANLRREHIIKGFDGKSIEIITGLGYGDCGDDFTVGEEYIVYAYDVRWSEKNDGYYETSIC